MESFEAVQNLLLELSGKLQKYCQKNGYANIRSLRSDIGKGIHKICDKAIKAVYDSFIVLEAQILEKNTAMISGLAKQFWIVYRVALPEQQREDYFQIGLNAASIAIMTYNGKVKLTSYMYSVVKNELIAVTARRKKHIDLVQENQDQKVLDRIVEPSYNEDFNAWAIIDSTELSELEKKLVFAYMIGDRKARRKICETTISKKTGKPYTKARLEQIFRGACEKIERKLPRALRQEVA